MAHSPPSSDDEAPESFTFSASKKASRAQSKALEKFRADEKQKLKEKRRERDRALKEGKIRLKEKERGKGDVEQGVLEGREGKGEDLREERADDELEAAEGTSKQAELQARMERAMQEAQEELDNDESLDEDDAEGEVASSDVEEDESADEAATDSDSQENAPPRPPLKKAKLSKNPDYLPDHLFASALSEAATLASAAQAESKAKKPTGSSKPKKRKRAKNASNDIVVGSRTIRRLPPSSEHAAPATKKTLAPPATVNKFINRTLGLSRSEANAKVKCWERRGANIGVMKRNGPAAQFVRS